MWAGSIHLAALVLVGERGHCAARAFGRSLGHSGFRQVRGQWAETSEQSERCRLMSDLPFFGTSLVY